MPALIVALTTAPITIFQNSPPLSARVIGLLSQYVNRFLSVSAYGATVIMFIPSAFINLPVFES